MDSYDDDAQSAAEHQAQLDERQQIEDGWRSTLRSYRESRDYAMDMARGWKSARQYVFMRASVDSARQCSRRLVAVMSDARKYGIDLPRHTNELE